MKGQFVYSSPHKGIRVEFTGKNLTKFGGTQLVRKFLRRLKVEEELESAVGIKKRDGKFTVGGMLVSLLCTLILDMRRQSCLKRLFSCILLVTRRYSKKQMRNGKEYINSWRL